MSQNPKTGTAPPPTPDTAGLQLTRPIRAHANTLLSSTNG